VGPNGSLTQQIAKGIIPSLILWGPPGTGKQLWHKYSTGIKTPFYILSAINSGVKDIREVIEKRNKVEVFSPPRIQFYL
jgi:putative ATPase